MAVSNQCNSLSVFNENFGMGMDFNNLKRQFREWVDTQSTSYPVVKSSDSNGTSVSTLSDKFEVTIDVYQFKSEEITIKVIGTNTICVEGNHEEQHNDCGFLSRHFVRKYTLPNGYDIKKVVSSLSSDGILRIIAPRNGQTVDDYRSSRNRNQQTSIQQNCNTRKESNSNISQTSSGFETHNYIQEFLQNVDSKFKVVPIRPVGPFENTNEELKQNFNSQQSQESYNTQKTIKQSSIESKDLYHNVPIKQTRESHNESRKYSTDTEKCIQKEVVQEYRSVPIQQTGKQSQSSVIKEVKSSSTVVQEGRNIPIERMNTQTTTNEEQMYDTRNYKTVPIQQTGIHSQTSYDETTKRSKSTLQDDYNTASIRQMDVDIQETCNTNKTRKDVDIDQVNKPNPVREEINTNVKKTTNLDETQQYRTIPIQQTGVNLQETQKTNFTKTQSTESHYNKNTTVDEGSNATSIKNQSAPQISEQNLNTTQFDIMNTTNTNESDSTKALKTNTSLPNQQISFESEETYKITTTNRRSSTSGNWASNKVQNTSSISEEKDLTTKKLTEQNIDNRQCYKTPINEVEIESQIYKNSESQRKTNYEEDKFKSQENTNLGYRMVPIQQIVDDSQETYQKKENTNKAQYTTRVSEEKVLADDKRTEHNIDNHQKQQVINEIEIESQTYKNSESQHKTNREEFNIQDNTNQEYRTIPIQQIGDDSQQTYQKKQNTNKRVTNQTQNTTLISEENDLAGDKRTDIDNHQKQHILHEMEIESQRNLESQRKMTSFEESEFKWQDNTNVQYKTIPIQQTGTDSQQTYEKTLNINKTWTNDQSQNTAHALEENDLAARKRTDDNIDNRQCYKTSAINQAQIESQIYKNSEFQHKTTSYDETEFKHQDKTNTIEHKTIPIQQSGIDSEETCGINESLTKDTTQKTRAPQDATLLNKYIKITQTSEVLMQEQQNDNGITTPVIHDQRLFKNNSVDSQSSSIRNFETENIQKQFAQTKQTNHSIESDQTNEHNKGHSFLATNQRKNSSSTESNSSHSQSSEVRSSSRKTSKYTEEGGSTNTQSFKTSEQVQYGSGKNSNNHAVALKHHPENLVLQESDSSREDFIQNGYKQSGFTNTNAKSEFETYPDGFKMTKEQSFYTEQTKTKERNSNNAVNQEDRGRNNEYQVQFSVDSNASEQLSRRPSDASGICIEEVTEENETRKRSGCSSGYKKHETSQFVSNRSDHTVHTQHN